MSHDPLAEKAFASENNCLYGRIGFVYFITFENPIIRQQNPYIKIGTAIDVTDRLKSLQTGSPFKLTIVGTIRSNNPFELEQYLLDRFSKSRACGEWVHVNSSIITTIKRHDLVIDHFEEFFPTDQTDEKDLLIEQLKRELVREKLRYKQLLAKYTEEHRIIKQLNHAAIDRGAPRIRNLNWKTWLEGELK